MYSLAFCYIFFILSLSEVFGDQENTIFETNQQELQSCSIVSSVKGSLQATETVATAVQQLVTNVRYQMEKIEKHFCKLPDLNHRGSDFHEGAKDCSPAPSNCYQIQQKQEIRTNGIYRIWPRYLDHSILVYCDLQTGLGGWTVIQRREDLGDNQTNFYRNWNSYKRGFGNISSEFWIGNEVIFALANEVDSVLRIELEDFEGEKKYAEYQTIDVLSERHNYKLTISGYEGNAGDAMISQNDQMFTTFDKNDHNNCAATYKGGWWYAKCHAANLNGKYLRGNHSTFADGVNWQPWKGYNYSLKRSEIKIRPKIF